MDSDSGAVALTSGKAMDGTAVDAGVVMEGPVLAVGVMVGLTVESGMTGPAGTTTAGLMGALAVDRGRGITGLINKNNIIYLYTNDNIYFC